MTDWIRDDDKQCVTNPQTGFTVFWLNALTPAELPPRYAIVKGDILKGDKSFGVYSTRFNHVDDRSAQRPSVVLGQGGVPIRFSKAPWNNFDRISVSEDTRFSSTEEQNEFLAAIKGAMPHIPIDWGGGPDLGYEAVFAPEFEKKMKSGEFLE